MSLAIIAILVSLGIAGACAGSIFARSWAGLHRLTSLTSGLFLGIAVMLVFPEALHSSSWQIVLLFSVAGCMLFAWVEVRLHRSLHHSAESQSSARQWAMIFFIIGIHNILDGWNIGIAVHLAERGFAAAFSLGMGIHKLVGGFAVGAILRRSSKRLSTNIAFATFAEALTILGCAFEVLVLPHLGKSWIGWVLAATGGSFLFLSFHIFAEAHRADGLRRTLQYAVLGFLIISLAAASERL